jgi:hypothetical protein
LLIGLDPFQLVLLSAQMAKVIYVDSPLTPQAAMLLKLVAPRLDDRQLSDFVKQTSQQQQQQGEEPEQEEAADTDDDVDSDWDEVMESEDDDEDNFDPFCEFESCPHFANLKEDFDREVILVKISL